MFEEAEVRGALPLVSGLAFLLRDETDEDVDGNGAAHEGKRVGNAVGLSDHVTHKRCRISLGYLVPGVLTATMNGHTVPSSIMGELKISVRFLFSQMCLQFEENV